MFFLSYISAEVRRRAGRTALTALGLAVGVALVVVVNAFSSGVDDAQEEVLRPLTGVGTDMTVTRPLRVRRNANGDQQFGALSRSEQEQLREENGGGSLRLEDLGDPGERFSRDQFLSTSQLSFPASRADAVAGLEGVKAVSAGLTLSLVRLEGEVPEAGGDQLGPAGAPAPGAAPRSVELDSRTVSGVDPAQPDLGLLTRSRITEGRWFSADGSRREAILTAAYAKRQGLDVGERFRIAGRRFTVVGSRARPWAARPPTSTSRSRRSRPSPAARAASTPSRCGRSARTPWPASPAPSSARSRGPR